jgi:hypothetical protein
VVLNAAVRPYSVAYLSAIFAATSPNAVFAAASSVRLAGSLPTFQVYTAVSLSNVYFTLLRVLSFLQAKVAVAVTAFVSSVRSAVAAIALVIGSHASTKSHGRVASFKQVPSALIVVPLLAFLHARTAASYAALSLAPAVNKALLVLAVSFYALASTIAFSFNFLAANQVVYSVVF